MRTSVCDCSETSTASALVTQPEHARQSVSDIEAGGGGSAAAAFSSVVTSYGSYDLCQNAPAFDATRESNTPSYLLVALEASL